MREDHIRPNIENVEKVPISSAMPQRSLFRRRLRRLPTFKQPKAFRLIFRKNMHTQKRIITKQMQVGKHTSKCLGMSTVKIKMEMIRMELHERP